MPKTLEEWVATDVEDVRDRPLSWLSESYFFRDPSRPVYSDSSVFLSPADGIVVYQAEVDPKGSIVDIKGKPYSLREALRDDTYDRRSLVIGIFMTFYDVHVNRIPYPGRLSYRELEPIDSYNHPMLEVEKNLLEDLRVSTSSAEYLRKNQRMVNRIDTVELGHSYYVLQIADYDVDSILPFQLKQNQPCAQGARFSQIRYGSQVDLIIPLCDCHEYTPLLKPGLHVEAGMDPLVRVRRRSKVT